MSRVRVVSSRLSRVQYVYRTRRPEARYSSAGGVRRTRVRPPTERSRLESRVDFQQCAAVSWLYFYASLDRGCPIARALCVVLHSSCVVRHVVTSAQGPRPAADLNY